MSALHRRPHIMQSVRAALARMCVAALFSTAVAGCQNNAANDLIARDRRMQEDQIYALQDYVKQYQQLVCRYRSENANLRRQLTDGYPVQPSPADELQAMPRNHENSVIRPTPQFQTPQTPATRERSTAPEPQPLSPPPAIETPDVPPLKTSANDEGEAAAAATANATASDNIAPQVLSASYEEPVTGAAASSADEDDVVSAIGATEANTDTPVEQSSLQNDEVLLSGEVVANESGGPRLMIDVTPNIAPGDADVKNGTISLMLMAPGPDGGRQSLGRWDFGPENVRAAIVDPNSSPQTLRFFVELPADSQVDTSSELWARVLPSKGMKLLAHAPVDLTTPGTFTSNPAAMAPASGESVVAANYSEDAVEATSGVSSTINEGKWVTAEPGKPANLPTESADAIEGNGWRASLEPMPAVIATSVAAPPRAAEEPTNNEPIVDAEPRVKAPLKRPGWAADRPGKSADRTAARPSWSATR